MRLLLDNNLSPALVGLLNEAGHDVVHVRSYAMQAAPDAEVLSRARDEGRVLISADTDFGALLARERLDAPSVVLIRRITDRRAAAIARLLIANLGAIADDLDAGAIVVVGEATIRSRRLPIV